MPLLLTVHWQGWNQICVSLPSKRSRSAWQQMVRLLSCTDYHVLRLGREELAQRAASACASHWQKG